MSKDKPLPEPEDYVLTEFDEETGEWEVVGHDDEDLLEAEAVDMLRSLGINGPKPQPPHAG